MVLRHATGLWVSIVLLSIAGAQNSAPPQHVTRDWSSSHIIFTGLTPETVGEAVYRDPRAWHSWLEHARYRFVPPPNEVHNKARFTERRRRAFKKAKIDWNMGLFTGASAVASPAKFSFDVNATPDCTNDYVVFPTGNVTFPGSSAFATLLAFNNLYVGPGPSGICPTITSPATDPVVLFAYNTATVQSGKADLSPVLSLDGKKIAFMESNDGFAENYAAFHVLTWKAGEGTSWNSAATPGDCSPGNSCMTTLVLNNAHSDSLSNPFVDYAHDTAYVGDDGGLLHKITPVFNGTPQEVIGNGWPVQLHAAFDLVESPVYDSVSGRIFVSDWHGHTFYVVDAASGGIVNSVPFFLSSLTDPIVDSTNQTVFVMAVLYPVVYPTYYVALLQFDTSGTVLREIDVGPVGSGGGYTGAFDQRYFANPSSGAFYFASTVNYVASLYSVGFTGTTMNSSYQGPLILGNGSSTSVPTGLTEMFNPSFSNAPDRLFLGVQQSCVGANACIESFDITNGFPSGILELTQLGGPGVGGIIVDNVSASPQASSIYFEGSPPAGTFPSAIKLTQSSLQ